MRKNSDIIFLSQAIPSHLQFFVMEGKRFP